MIKKIEKNSNEAREAEANTFTLAGESQPLFTAKCEGLLYFLPSFSIFIHSWKASGSHYGGINVPHVALELQVVNPWFKPLETSYNTFCFRKMLDVNKNVNYTES